jgi:transposase InsO family protein
VIQPARAGDPLGIDALKRLLERVTREHSVQALADFVGQLARRPQRLALLNAAMSRAGLSGQIKRRRGKTTVRVQGVRTAPDLVERDINPTRINRLWCADITYIRTWEGWLYLASVMECFSRRIVGWALADHLRAELVLDALEMAVARRRPAPGLVHHSDQGSQYTSLIFTRRCRNLGIDVSMGGRGDCFDNSAMASFHATLKKGGPKRTIAFTSPIAAICSSPRCPRHCDTDVRAA